MKFVECIIVVIVLLTILTIAFGIPYCVDHYCEITPAEYAYVRSWIHDEPKLKSKVAAFLNDNKITRDEYAEIYALHRTYYILGQDASN